MLRHASLRRPFAVLESDSGEGVAPSDPTLTEYRKAYSDAVQAAKDANDAASAASEAAGNATASAEKADGSAAAAENAAAGAGDAAAYAASQAADAKRAAGGARLAASSAEEAASAANKAAADASQAASSANGAASDAAEKADAADAKAKAAESAATLANDAAQKANDASSAANSAAVAANSAAQKAAKSSDSADESAAKADKSAESADDAATRAGNAADAALASVKNVLTSESSNADDAFEGAKFRGLTVKGNCVQDGIPSPDNPVDIQVIENPKLLIANRNIIKPGAVTYAVKFEPGFTYTSNGITWEVLDDYSVKASGTAEAKTSYFNIDFETDATSLRGKKLFYQKKGSVVVANCGVFLPDGTFPGVASGSAVPANATKLRYYLAVPSESVGKTVNETFRPMVSVGSQPSEWRKPERRELSFTLPEGHPYLAKLVDGTADEIQVDEKGNVVLVARVGRDTNITKADTFVKGMYFRLVAPKIVPFTSEYANCSPALCSAFESDTGKNPNGVYRVRNGIFVRNPSFETKEELDAAISAASPITVYAVQPEKRYTLGTIDMPAAPDTIFNIIPQTGIPCEATAKYERDVNVVIGKLEAAIVATGASM